ncbi:UPF0149 family protein [Pseudoxanthomonas sp.]|uniref:UPF0149 family protein n=1 Tax=Pseudoxanthomonas sp. TaxID=1871049 RepID=UPI00262A0960|nr:UPF0149 family protein [Pseudoxanthomonas sp.]WDS35824.1 MAG: UPF0149 family protein [Pseudoxanthomonas sp.]
MDITGGLRPMTEAELERLDGLLSGPECGERVMTLEMLDGFLSALVVGPELVMPSEYLPYIWGEASEGPGLGEAADAIPVIMQLWNHIAWRVQQPIDDEADLDAQAFLMPPLVLPDTEDEDTSEDPLAGVPDDFPFAAAWANGFLLGVSLRAEAWEAMVAGDEDLQDDMGMLVSLSVVDAGHADEMDVPAEDLMDLQERVSAAVELPGMLHDMNLRRLNPVVREPIRREVVPGRNDPCACGSGKKYKKCCGAADKLH